MPRARRADSPVAPDERPSLEARVALLIHEAHPDAAAAVRAQADAALEQLSNRSQQNPTEQARGWRWAADVRRLILEHDVLDRRARHLESLAAGGVVASYPDARAPGEVDAQLVESFGRAGGLASVGMATDAARRQVQLDSESLIAVRCRIGRAVGILAGTGEGTGVGGLPVARGTIEAELRDDLLRISLLEARVSRLGKALEQLPEALGEAITEVIADHGGSDGIALSLWLTDASISDVDAGAGTLRDDLAKLNDRFDHMLQVSRGTANEGKIAGYRQMFVAPVEAQLAEKRRAMEASHVAVAASARAVVDRAEKGDVEAIKQIHQAVNRGRTLFSQGFDSLIVDACARALARAGNGAFARALAPDLVTAVDPLPVDA